MSARMFVGRRRTAFAVLVALIVAAVALVGCTGNTGRTTGEPAAPAPAATASFPLTITDDAGRSVTIEEAPARIVSLAPANTEIVYALGLFDRLVGVTTWDDYPTTVADVAKVGDFMTPNLEAIAAADPDVVLVTGGVQAETLGKLEELGVPVVVVDPQDLAGVYDAIEMVAGIAGVPAKGAELTTSMKKDLDDIRAKLADVEPVKVFIEIGWNPLFTAGPGTLLDDLLTAAGGTNVVTESGYVGYSVEQLVKDQPDVYVGTLSSVGSAKVLSKRPGYSSISAVKAGRVYSLSDNLVSRPGPRVIQGVREIATALHPDLFK